MKLNLLIINDYGIFGGGTETRIRIFVDELLQRQFDEQQYNEIHILQRFSAPTLEKKYASHAIYFHTLTKKQSPYLLARKIMKRYNIHLVQAHNLLALEPYVLLAAKQAGIPVVWWVHDYWLLCAKRSFIDPFHAKREELCIASAQKQCSQCMSFKTQLKYAIWKKIMNYCVALALAPSLILQNIHEQQGVLQGRWNVITPWIDPSFFHDAKKIQTTASLKKTMNINKTKKKQEKVLLFVGSLIEFKGAWVAAAALKNIVKKFPYTKLVFVGNEQESTSRYRQEIEQQCINDGTHNNILFLGKRNKEEILELYKETDIYLCPTVCMESFGLNWAEAMAFGLPVVASAIGSIPEYIEDKKTGLLFPPRDYEGLAQAVLTLLADSTYSQCLATNGKIYAQNHFTSQRAVADICKCYALLLQKEKDSISL